MQTKFYSHLSAVAREQGHGLCVVRFSNKYRNIYSSYLWKQTSGSSAKSNIQRDVRSPRFYLQCSRAFQAGCAALNGFKRCTPSRVSVQALVCTWVPAAVVPLLQRKKSIRASTATHGLRISLPQQYLTLLDLPPQSQKSSKKIISCY